MYAITYCFFKLVALLPFRVLYGISDFLYLIIYHIIKYRIKVVRLNLQNSFPEKSDAWRKDIEKKYYRHLCDNIVETIKLLHLSDKDADRRIIVTNGDLIDRLAQDGRSFMLLLGHYGNWEWVPAITRHYHLPYSGQIYRPLRNPSFDRLFLKIRSRFNSVCIAQKQAVRSLLQIQKTHQMLIGFVADQRPNTSNVNHHFQFLNQDTNFSVGAEFIGSKINAHFVFMDVKPLKRGYVQLTFREILPEQYEGEKYPITRRYVEMLEEVINRAPEYWLWSHNRWSLSYKNKK